MGPIDPAPSAADRRRSIRQAWAHYLHRIHNRIHPRFAKKFLDSLGTLPPDHPLNDPSLMVRLEIEIEPEQGRIEKVRILKASGLADFDLAALKALEDAAGPGGFGKAPAEAISKEGKVVIIWEFHRPREIACATINARPVSFVTPLPARSPVQPPAPPPPPVAPPPPPAPPAAPPLMLPQPYPW